IFGGAPVNMIIFAQAITIIAVPFIAIALLVVANDKKIMCDLKNTLFKNIIAIAGLIVLILLAINNINNIFIYNQLCGDDMQTIEELNEIMINPSSRFI